MSDALLDISLRSNVDAVARQLDDLAYRQLPFAESRTVTELAKLAAQAERKAIPEVFPNPTPFTVNSVAVQAARKGLPIARVYVRDKTAEYLAPYEYGGVQFLGKKPADLVPVGAAVNQYGNLPRGLIRRYLNRPDVFIGTVRTKSGDLYGVWQRAATAQPKKGRRAPNGLAPNTTGRLKLLIAFHAPVETKNRLRFGERAEALVLANVNHVFGRELAKAIAAAR
ncbi:hypothetical protein QFZ94_007480 [Paraburkholderia sp. JPY465]|uniref:hypothetical protein n=1 Tax=Paraburkholderia sp. JPY465 TaxID=3042285 RepID=UPI003D1F66F8